MANRYMKRWSTRDTTSHSLGSYNQKIDNKYEQGGRKIGIVMHWVLMYNGAATL